ncbi:MAG: hypothetical protein ACRCX2_01230 [Paraclostridium sp.]
MRKIVFLDGLEGTGKTSYIEKQKELYGLKSVSILSGIRYFGSELIRNYNYENTVNVFSNEISFANKIIKEFGEEKYNSFVKSQTNENKRYTNIRESKLIEEDEETQINDEIEEFSINIKENFKRFYFLLRFNCFYNSFWKVFYEMIEQEILFVERSPAAIIFYEHLEEFVVDVDELIEKIKHDIRYKITARNISIDCVFCFRHNSENEFENQEKYYHLCQRIFGVDNVTLKVSDNCI